MKKSPMGLRCDIDGIFVIELFHADHDLFVQRAGNVLSDIIGADRQFAVAAVDKHGQLDLSGPAKAGDRVHRRADGASLEEHVIDEDDFALLYRNGLAAVLCALVVISPEAHIERIDRDLGMFERLDQRGQPSGQVNAAAADADQDDIIDAFVVLDDLMGNALQ